MKHNGIILTGHQRSGTHYIAALVSLNFLKNQNYQNIYIKHKLPDVVKNKNIAYIYTWRNFEEIAKSLFKMRRTFGLNNVDSFNSFLDGRYCDMWKPMNHSGVKVVDLKGNIRIDVSISKGFRDQKQTPREWWKFYYGQWEEARKQNENIIRVSYDDLKLNFQKTMKGLAKKLGSSKRRYTNIENKVGWYVPKLQTLNRAQ